MIEMELPLGLLKVGIPLKLIDGGFQRLTDEMTIGLALGIALP